jgi:threonyl-tRNA synthetase
MKTGKKKNAIINAAADKGLNTVVEYGEAAFMVQS